MSAIEFPTIGVAFGLDYQPGQFFTLDNATYGVLDNPTYLLAGDVPVDISEYLVGFSIRRGRATERDEFAAGTLSATFENYERTLDALNAAGVYYGDLKAGKQVVVTMYGVTLYDGRTEEWPTRWPVNEAPTAELLAVDELGLLARREFDAWTTTASQTAGPRITDVLNRNEVEFGSNRSIGTGISTLQADNVTWGSNVLNYLQLVAQSDGGRLYVSRDGVLTFKDRRSLVGLTPKLTFRDDLTGYDFTDVETASGSRFQVNRVGIDRLGGILQTVEDAPAQADGIRSLSIRGLLMDSDVQSHAMASYLLNIYKDPADRVSSITVNVTALDETTRATVSALDIGDAVSIVWTPNAVGDPVEQLLVVDGVDHWWTNGSPHYMRISTTPAFQQAVFRLDDALWGVLDSGPGRLAY